MDTELFSLLDADSVSRTINIIRDTLTKIAENTTPQKVMVDTDVNVGNFFIAFISLVVSVISAWFGFLAYHFSKKTADNVVRMTKDNQIAQFNDFIRHLYRNLVCTLAIKRAIESMSDHNAYPSEDHILKLKMLPEDVIHLEKYNDDKHVYMKMHELKLLLRNYDTEIDVSVSHFKDPSVSRDELLKNLDGLSFKPFYLIKRIIDIENVMTEKRGPKGKRFLCWRRSSGINHANEAARVIISEHFNKLAENLKSNKKEEMRCGYKFDEKYCKIYEEESGGSGCTRAYRILHDSYYLDNSETDTLKLKDIVSEKNPFIDESNLKILTGKKTREKGGEMFQNMFNFIYKDQTCSEYINFFTEETNSFVKLIPTVLSVDVSIEQQKIRILNFR